MGSSIVDHDIQETLFSMENSFQENQENPENQEIGASISGKCGISGKKGSRKKGKWRRRKKGGVLLEGYVAAGEEEEQEGPNGHLQGLNGQKEEGFKGFSRTKSHLDELKGCLDLGFGFSYEETPELCNTLLALELCYSISQRFMDEQQKPSPSESSDVGSVVGSPIANNWKISSPEGTILGK